jgi:SAM-dependent methyltransferase
MTAVEAGRRSTPPAPADPFAARPAAPGHDRPRVLSYVGRWGRARRWLPAEALRVLDVGCSFGYGTAAIVAGGPPGRVAVGVERDPGHLAEGARRFPWVRILDGDATALPVPDGAADAVTALDVLEHVAEPRRAIAEAHRVLRPGGVLVVSVPHRGLLWRLDALNVQAALRRRWPQLPAPAPAAESGGHEHRHYTPRDVEEVLAPHFVVDRIARTGIGLQELVHLGLLILSVALRQQRLTRALRPLHLGVYLVDDLLPLGRFGYHLTVRAIAAPADPIP